MTVSTNAAHNYQCRGLQGKFDVKDFVGTISEKLIAQSKADPGRAYNTKAFTIALTPHISIRSETIHPYIRSCSRQADRSAQGCTGEIREDGEDCPDH